MRDAKQLLAIVSLALIVGGCGSPSIASAPPVAPTTPSATVDAVPPTEAELDAQRFRADFGLRSDLEWIRTVAANPASDRTTYGVPLTVAEVAELNRRSMTLEEFREQVINYAVGQPDYAGAWIDQQRGGVLIVQFAGPTLVHQVKILSMSGPVRRSRCERSGGASRTSRRGSTAFAPTQIGS